MGAGIYPGKDKGVVGYVDELGQTWHLFEEYEHINGPVSIDKARETLLTPVEKISLILSPTPEQIQTLLDNGLTDEQIGELLSKPVEAVYGGHMYALMHMERGDTLFGQSVTDDYEVILNDEFLDYVENLMGDPHNLTIESCGTLFAGRVSFVNIMLKDITIAGDISPTIYRLMYTNAYGGRAITAGLHWIRIVCNNTLTMAEAQAAATATLRKFTHTKGTPGRVQAHLIELTGLYRLIDEQNVSLQWLADQSMNGNDVDKFLTTLFPLKEKAHARLVASMTKKRDRIRELFETRADLQGGIARTRFAMLQAVTFHTSHDMAAKRGTDFAYAWHKTLTDPKDNRNVLARTAVKLLESEDLTLVG